MAETNFTVRTSGSFNFVAEVVDDSDVAVNITGYTVNMDIKKSDGTTVASNVATITTPASGLITVLVADCSAWPVETLYYDLVLTNGGVKDPILYGSITVEQGVSTS
jgi:hypothetical protein